VITVGSREVPGRKGLWQEIMNNNSNNNNISWFLGFCTMCAGKLGNNIYFMVKA
jgi:hypothetical protein